MCIYIRLSQLYKNNGIYILCINIDMYMCMYWLYMVYICISLYNVMVAKRHSNISYMVIKRVRTYSIVYRVGACLCGIIRVSFMFFR